MRVMDLYRIEYDYRRHKQRLDSIRRASSKDKISRMTSQHFHSSNERTKMKNMAEQFQGREEQARRDHQQSLFNRTIQDYSHRQPHPASLRNSRTNSTPRPARLHKIELEKEKTHKQEMQKIDKVRSVYQGYHRPSNTEARHKSKDQRLQLLRDQFQFDGSLVYPQGRRPSQTTLQPRAKQDDL